MLHKAMLEMKCTGFLRGICPRHRLILVSYDYVLFKRREILNVLYCL